MLDYFTPKKGKAPARQQSARRESEPLLSDSDEQFLQKITSQIEGTPPPLPDRQIAGDPTGNNAQLVLFSDDAQDVPLPDVPDTPQEEASSTQKVKSPTSPTSPTAAAKKRRWSFLQLGRRRDRQATASTLDSAMADMKAAEAAGLEPQAVSADEATKEKDEVTDVLEKLNLAAVNNQVFSFSEESRVLLRKYGSF